MVVVTTGSNNKFSSNFRENEFNTGLVEYTASTTVSKQIVSWGVVNVVETHVQTEVHVHNYATIQCNQTIRSNSCGLPIIAVCGSLDPQGAYSPCDSIGLSHTCDGTCST